MMKNKTTSYVIIAVLAAVVVGLGIAYAALSTTLNVNFGTVTQDALTWNVHWVAASNLAATEVKTSTTGFSCGKASTSASTSGGPLDTVSVTATTLSKPDDKCTWALQIKNDGGIQAKLGTITAVQPSGKTCTVSGASMVCGNVTYKLTTDAAGTTLLAANSTINAGVTLNVYLVAMYNDPNLNDSAADTQTSAGFTLVYNQN